MSCVTIEPVFGVSCKHWAVQPQKTVRGWKFPIYIVEEYYTSYIAKTKVLITLTKMKRLLQGCSSVAATMQQSNMYATTGDDKVAN